MKELKLRKTTHNGLKCYKDENKLYMVRKDEENGRWVSKNVHDESYDKFIVTLTELSKRGLFDRAKVYRRGRESENGIPYQIYSTEGREFSNAIEAVLYGRKAYRKDAVERYETMHDLVQEVFEQKAPELLPNLKEWEKLYEAER